MAKRPRKGSAEDLLYIASSLPWWVGLLLAGVSFFALHSVATRPLPELGTPPAMGTMVVGQPYRTLAQFGQVIVLVLLIIGAAVSYWETCSLVLDPTGVQENLSRSW